MSVLVSGKRVRVKAAKDVADSAARDGLDGASALPHPERHLKVLAAPDVHFFVVGSDLPEVLPVDGEEAASHGRGSDGCHGMSLAILLHGLGNVDPEVERDVALQKCELIQKFIDKTSWRTQETRCLRRGFEILVYQESMPKINWQPFINCPKWQR